MQCVHRRPNARSDIDDFVVTSVEGEQICAGDIANVDVILLLLAIPVDADGAPRQYPAAKDSDHPGFAARILPRSVDVAIAQRRIAYPTARRKISQIMFGNHLRDAIRGFGQLRMLLVDRKILRRPIGCARRRKNDLADLIARSEHQDVEQPFDIHIRVKGRVFGRDSDAVLGSVMAHNLGLKARKNIRESTVADVDFKALGFLVEICAPSPALRPERVDDSDFVARADKRIHDVGADKPSTAGYQDAHNRTPKLAANLISVELNATGGDGRSRRAGSTREAR